MKWRFFANYVDDCMRTLSTIDLRQLTVKYCILFPKAGIRLYWSYVFGVPAHVDEARDYFLTSVEKAEIDAISSAVSADGSGKAIRSKSQPRLLKQRRRIIKNKAGRTVAKVIEFYPNNFRKNLKYASREQRGKVIEFAPAVKKSA